MKKVIIFLLSLFCITQSAFAKDNRAEDNPAFLGKENQIMIHGGLSVRSSGFERYREINDDGSRGDWVPNLGIGMISYSQPTTLFRLTARRNIELGAIAGKKDGIVDKEGNRTPKDFSQYNQAIGGVSEELVLGGRYLYLTAGIGAYLKSKTTNRISSKFTFGERVGLGTNLGPVNLEVFLRHFSNGALTEYNSGQNFAGLSLGVKF